MTGRLPTPPGVVFRLLALTRREDVAVSEVAELVGGDAALAAKILRFVNSPMAGVRHEITSLQRAVALVGVRGATMTALSFTVLRSIKGEVCRGFNRQQYAVQSLGCGIAAKALASWTETAPPDEAFLAGLLSQIGRLVLAIGIPDDYARVIAEARQIPRDLPPLETRILGEAYPAVGAQVLRSWQIPESLCAAIASFRASDREQQASPLAKILRVAEIAAGVICPQTKGDPPDTRVFVEAAHDLPGIDNDRCADLIHVIATEIDSARTMLDIPKGEMRSPDNLQFEVRERIAELALAMHLESQSMATQQQELMRKATTDALTGVGNRVEFDARMALELQRAGRSGTPLALLMIDVDKFKVLNDTYGHPAGDRVLQVVAHALDTNVRKVDYVARYGGDEFAIIAPDTLVEGVSSLAERLRRAVEGAAVRWEGTRLHVTISIGVSVYTDILNVGEASHIIRAADARLYAAKRAGRNCVEVAADAPAPATAGASTL
jgi:diguanylate cyclase (GGDEF)-like protein